jgi:hypothetical protein
MVSSHVIIRCYYPMLSSDVIIPCYHPMLLSHVIIQCYQHRWKQHSFLLFLKTFTVSHVWVDLQRIHCHAVWHIWKDEKSVSIVRFRTFTLEMRWIFWTQKGKNLAQKWVKTISTWMRSHHRNFIRLFDTQKQCGNLTPV